VAVTQGADGIINPPIDELLEIVDSKYRLVILAAKRARQINAYYSQLGEGLLDRAAGGPRGPAEGRADRGLRLGRGYHPSPDHRGRQQHQTLAESATASELGYGARHLGRRGRYRRVQGM
jgi:DNA-directed RNA polymerase omega subunit